MKTLTFTLPPEIVDTLRTATRRSEMINAADDAFKLFITFGAKAQQDAADVIIDFADITSSKKIFVERFVTLVSNTFSASWLRLHCKLAIMNDLRLASSQINNNC